MQFFFDIRSDSETDKDLEGVDLPSLDAARKEALKAAREMVAEMVLQNERIDGKRFEILDERGRILDIVQFREVIDLG